MPVKINAHERKKTQHRIITGNSFQAPVCFTLANFPADKTVQNQNIQGLRVMCILQKKSAISGTRLADVSA